METKKYPPNSFIEISSINFKNADVRDVYRGLALQYKTNISVDNKIDKSISVALFRITLFDAIKIIARDNDLDFDFDGERFFIRNKVIIEDSNDSNLQNHAEIDYDNGYISIVAKTVEINTFIEDLRNMTPENYLLARGTEGSVTGTLKQVPMENALNNLLQNNGFLINKRDSIYYISRSTYYSSLDNSSPHTSQNYWVSAKNDKITLDVTQADLNHVVNDIANQLQLQIIKLDVPNTAVTVRCYEVSLDKAFSYLFTGTEYSFREDQGAYILGKRDIRSLDNTKLCKLHYLQADKIIEMIPDALTEKVSVSLAREHNGLIFNGSNEDIANLEYYINEIDQPVPQVMIEALVVDYNLDEIYNLGISAGIGDSTTNFRSDKYYPSVDMTVSGAKINQTLKDIGHVNLFGKDVNVANLGVLPDDFYMKIQAMEQNGIANVRSKPILSTLNGHSASLEIGTVQNYVFKEVVPITTTTNVTYIEKERIEKIEANISFKITPWVGPNKELTLEINPDFQTPTGDFSPDKNEIPAINTRTFSSTVRIKNGETIVLGGLIQDIETTTEDKFPILSDIPIIGSLFTNINRFKSKSELIIYVTPRISYGDDYSYLYYDYAK